MQSAFIEWFAAIGSALLAIAQMAPSKGYEPYFAKQGWNLIAARGMAHLMTRRGKRIAADRKVLREVASAIRFLAKHHRHRKAICRRVDALLQTWQKTTAIEAVFASSGLDEIEFIRTLEAFAAGDVAYDPVQEIAASLVPHLPTLRGLMVSAASAAHEAFLECVNTHCEPRAYTWNEVDGTWTDPLTEATRLEFGLSRFDPRPAYRRLRARPNKL